MAKRRQKSDKQLSPVLQGMRTALIATILFLVYSYSTQALEINLDKPLDPQRQETALRALRALARPDFFTYNEEIRTMDVSIIMPCGDEIVGTQATNGERVATLRPNCASTTQDVLVLTGTGFRPRTSGLLRWHPPGDAPTRALTSFRTDGDGNFEVEFTMSDIRESDEPQRIEIEEKWQTGISGLSDASIITIEKITETVLLALVATTVGTILAVPLSFIAARNLMENVGMPLAALMAGLIAFPIAYLLTSQVMGWLLTLMATLYANFLVGVVVLVVLLVLIGLIVRFALLAPDNDTPTTSESVVHYAGLLVAVLALMLALAALSFVALDIGTWLEANLGIFAFVGGFIVLMAEFIAVLAPFFVGLLLGLTAMSVASRYGQEAVLKLETMPARILTVVLTGMGTAVVVYGLGSFLDWLYVFDEPIFWTVYPAVIGGILAAVGSFFVQPKRLTPVGFTAYTIVRGILNVIRSVEPLVYVIIFAVWVG
ncbi:MAG: hypothetical protein KDD89_02515, partial [Anaerolineales bacterium]|nr:hypothetical protein [Anaerolineales bacterium]